MDYKQAFYYFLSIEEFPFDLSYSNLKFDNLNEEFSLDITEKNFHITLK